MTVRFTWEVPVPEGAPTEVKGANCYFRPTTAEVSVCRFPLRTYITLKLHGPATRVEHNYSQYTWHMNRDDLPDWLMVSKIPGLAEAVVVVEGWTP